MIGLLRRPLAVATALVLSAATPAALAQSPESVRLVNDPALSPDGATIAFAWSGDIWLVPTAGGIARPLTRNPARDGQPSFSPDGQSIAFVSDRDGGNQVYVMPAQGGVPKQVTFHTGGFTLEGWFPDGKALLVSAVRDHGWNPRNGRRFFRVSKDERTAEQLLFDDYGADGKVSPDGKSLIFTREGSQWWRKGYKGSQASQVWTFDLESKAFKQVVNDPFGGLWPMFKPDGKGFYYVGMNKNAFNLREKDLATGADKPLTNFEDDTVAFPAISKDGSTIVFRHLFDLYRFNPAKGEPPAKIEILQTADSVASRIERRTLASAESAAFNKDGLEIAFISGGDLWVMDTELMEPKRITDTPEEERDPVFAPDGSAVLYVSDSGGQTDIWKATRADGDKYWWQNAGFKREKLTNDPDVESSLLWSPEGSKVAFVKGRGDLFVMNPDGKDAKKVLPNWNPPKFDWSPDGKWIVSTHEDNDFNDDVWVLPIDGSKPPYNLSKHPDDEGAPAWSPDGKMIAFTGRREAEETDVYYVYLRNKDEDQTRRERTLEKAIEKMKSGGRRGGGAGGATPPGTGVPPTPGGTAPGGFPGGGRRFGRPGGPGTSADQQAKAQTPAKAEAKAETKAASTATPATPEPKKPPEVVIDFEGIHERLHRVSIPNSTEGGLVWSPDSKKLAFTATVNGERGIYTIEPPDDIAPKKLSGTTGSDPRWLESGNQIVLVAAGTPTSISGSGGRESGYRVRAYQTVDLPRKYQAAFDVAWRIMRDNWYDEKLGNRNWDAVRRKYHDMAGQVPDIEGLATVVQLMLGELNGSHLGFTPTSGGGGGGGRGPRRGPAPTPNPTEPTAPVGGSWTPATPHLGLRFDEGYKGPGLKVKDVLPDGPTSKSQSKIEAGEIVLRIDGTPVDPSMDLTTVLNGPLDRDVKLTVKNAKGEEREVAVRPIPFMLVQGLLYNKWIRDSRKAVEAGSKGTLGYLHIRGMDQPSFLKFEEELYSAGAGKDGLIIDVRENGGGSTADLLLTCLTQPLHAVTIPRGGGKGYPQDRMIFATWRKPIIVLCNQNSFSNAEIFSHAIKTLKRGKLVGVPTAGGVVSTGAATVMDVGILRLPARGWFLRDNGEDMELNGALPDIVVWPTPGDMPKGKDEQLNRAVEQLMADVAAEKAKPQPRLKKATER